MSVYSIAQAKDHLSKLIDEVLAAEEEAITRHGSCDLRAQSPRDASRPNSSTRSPSGRSRCHP
jgi:antitoxin (DNA-binding transcriptional repressor) of toxin-antitoxin stability system